MFGSKNTTPGTSSTTTTSNSGGMLSRLRNRSTTKKPIYTSSSARNTNTLGGSNNSNTGAGIKKGMFGKQKRSVGTGPAPMSQHRKAPTLGQKIHGKKTVVSGKMHNDHREVVAGESKFFFFLTFHNVDS